MRYSKYFLAFSFLLLPSTVLAASFAQSPIFLSESSVTQGDTVLVHAVIDNDAATQFTGSLLFQDGISAMGTLPVSLDAGGGNVFTVSWSPTAGSHTITATLEDGSGAVIEKETDTLTVAALPVTNGSSQAISVSSSAPIQAYIANFSPAVASATQPVFSTLDAVRQGAATVVQNQIAATEPKVIPSVLGTSTVYQVAQSQAGWSFPSVLWTAYYYFLTISEYLLTNAVLFYPVFVLLFFFLLWRLYKRMSRRR
jgi:hypothetical protein